MNPRQLSLGVRRVLIIDDDAMTTEHFARMLRLEGYEVETAYDGETGFRAAVSGGFDAVIVDLRMPVVGGLELLRQLRKAPSSHNTPVAIVTGDFLIDDATLTELHQFGAILRYKPLWLEDLTELTRTLVGSSPREDGPY
jgi:DNA-binding response OmpR family regulator